MWYGHGPSGVIGSTLDEKTPAIWALSHSTLGQLMADLESLKSGTRCSITSHKEERKLCVKSDTEDRLHIREALSTCIDIFDHKTHPTTGLVDIYSGQVVDDSEVNVHEALHIGESDKVNYEKLCPDGFHGTLTKNVKTMAMTMAIYVHVGQTNQCSRLRCSVSCGIQIHHGLSSLIDVPYFGWFYGHHCQQRFHYSFLLWYLLSCADLVHVKLCMLCSVDITTV